MPCPAQIIDREVFIWRHSVCSGGEGRQSHSVKQAAMPSALSYVTVLSNRVTKFRQILMILSTNGPYIADVVSSMRLICINICEGETVRETIVALVR